MHQELDQSQAVRLWPVAPAALFLDALRAAVGPPHVLTQSADTERFRRGWRSGEGEAEAVVRPGTLVEFWRALQLCVEAGRIVILQAANTGLTEGSTPNGTYGRPLVVVNTLRLGRIHVILGVSRWFVMRARRCTRSRKCLIPTGATPIR
jgi:D-lactate dehydrogenase